MTYPGLTSRRQRHDAALQLHLVRLTLAHVRQRAQAADPADRVARQVHSDMCAEARAQLASMRTLLHALFD
jgi:hypothetical protein